MLSSILTVMILTEARRATLTQYIPKERQHGEMTILKHIAGAYTQASLEACTHREDPSAVGTLAGLKDTKKMTIHGRTHLNVVPSRM